MTLTIISVYFNIHMTVPHKMVGLERMSDYRGVGLQRFYFTELRNVYYFCIILCVQSDLTGPHTSVLMKLWIKCAWEMGK